MHATASERADSDDCVIPIGGNWGFPPVFPVVMVSRNDGEALIAALEAGRAILLTLGGKSTRDARFESFVFRATLDESDPDPSNDRTVATTGVNRLPIDAPVRPAPSGRVGG